MTINFKCANPVCRKALRVRDELAGKRIKCPGCGQNSVAPNANLESKQATDTKLSNPKPGQKTPKRKDAKRQFTCPQCWKPFQVSLNDGEERATCPNPSCGALVDLSLATAHGVPTARKTASVTWVSSSHSGLLATPDEIFFVDGPMATSSWVYMIVGSLICPLIIVLMWFIVPVYLIMMPSMRRRWTQFETADIDGLRENAKVVCIPKKDWDISYEKGILTINEKYSYAIGSDNAECEAFVRFCAANKKQ